MSFIAVVPADSAYVVERLGKYRCTLPAGVHWLMPVLDRVAFRFSLLPKDEELSDRCITLDNLPITVSSTFRWQIVDPERAAYAAADARDFIREVVRTGQRQWISARRWDWVRQNTRELEAAAEESAGEAARGAGLKLVAVSVQRVERVAD